MFHKSRGWLCLNNSRVGVTMDNLTAASLRYEKFADSSRAMNVIEKMAPFATRYAKKNCRSKSTVLNAIAFHS